MDHVEIQFMINAVRSFPELNDMYLIKSGLLFSAFSGTCILTATSHLKVWHVRISELLAVPSALPV